MKNNFFVFFVLVIILGACQQGDNDSPSYAEKHEGVIVNIQDKETDITQGDSDAFEGWRFILVISDVEKDDISGKSDEELEDLAREKDGSYYNVSPEIYKEMHLETGMRVVMYYDSQGDASPPVRDAEKVDIVSNRK